MAVSFTLKDALDRGRGSCKVGTISLSLRGIFRRGRAVDEVGLDEVSGDICRT